MPAVLGSRLAVEHAREILALEARELRRLRGIYEEARLAIAGRLLEAPPESFTAQHLRSTLLQIRAGLVAMIRRLEEGRSKGLEEHLAMAVGQLAAEVDFWERSRGFGIRERIQLGALRRIDRELLAERFGESLRNWGNDVLAEVRRRLAFHVATRSTWQRMATDIAGKLRRNERRVIAGAQWKAERIVRTELHHALAQGHQAALEEAAEVLPGLRRQWDATLDQRTSPLCRVLEGQVVGIREAFTADGKQIASPPAHPNCRSRLLPWRREWARPRVHDL